MGRSQIENRKSKILIAGAGPAGSSLAIRLAQIGYDTTLVEREHFPRQKLCGEFISPECFAHFEKIGVLDEMLESGGDRILETRFYETGGKSVAVPTNWFGRGDFALSLSRAEMDNRLLERARSVGVNVLEGTTITGVEYRDGSVRSLNARSANGSSVEIGADFFVDATGRARVLSKFVAKQDSKNHKSAKPSLVGFKTHLASADLPKGSCEIYSFAGGYAGLSHVEGDVSNLCFLIEAATLRSIGSDPNDVVEHVVRRNRRADATLRQASPVRDWLAVAIDSFGTRTPAPTANLVTIGDAASFIDPFTGSGMVMAFESADVLAGILAADRGSFDTIAPHYVSAYRKRFTSRLRICSALRRTAFMPRVATATVSLLSASGIARRYLARATRK